MASSNKQVDVDILISNLKKKYGLSSKEVLNLAKNEEEIVLPVSIFNDKLGMLESACLYLKDEKKLSFKEIAKILKRDYKTVWTSYNKAKKKMGIKK
ncbi:MAG: hypothetical protein ABIJ18_01050 [archaeon]